MREVLARCENVKLITAVVDKILVLLLDRFEGVDIKELWAVCQIFRSDYISFYKKGLTLFNNYLE